VDDLSGKEVFVRKSSSFYESLQALNERLKAAGKPAVSIREAPENLEDEPMTELVNTMLDAAIQTVTVGSDRPVAHSDRGGHYRWPGWLSRIAKAQLVRSMSRKACSPDNAACEGFFARLRNEWFYSHDWLVTTIEEFVAGLDAYIRWYNEVRVKISLGSCSPVEYRRKLGIAA